MVIGITDPLDTWGVAQEIVTTGDFHVRKANHAAMAPDDSTVRPWLACGPTITAVCIIWLVRYY